MKKIAVIINKKAKNAARAKEYTQGLKEANIMHTFYETDPEHLVSTIKKCVKTYNIILVGGGDGTIRTAAQYCSHTSVILGVLPLGTLNHFSRELELPQSLEEIVNSIEHLPTLKIDLAEVNGMIFINNSSLGFYPRFADKRDVYTKIYNKWLSYIPSFIDSFKRHKAFSVTVKSKNLNLSLYTSFLMISNNLYSYDFPLTIQREDFQKALLGLYFFKQGKIQFFKIIKNLFSNKNNFEIHQSKYPIELHFNHQKEISISLDGDTVKINTPLVYKILPQSLTILMKQL